MRCGTQYSRLGMPVEWGGSYFTSNWRGARGSISIGTPFHRSSSVYLRFFVEGYGFPPKNYRRPSTPLRRAVGGPLSREQRDELQAQPDSRDPQHNAAASVQRGSSQITATDQRHRLQPERGEGGEAA